MLDLNPEIVCQIVERAREFQAQEAVVLPETLFSPSDDKALEALAGFADDLTYQEVRHAIEDLEPDQQIVLVALMWVGRGDFEVEDWDAAIEAASDNWTERTAEYLLATPLVADYLIEALDLHGYSCN